MVFHFPRIQVFCAIVSVLLRVPQTFLFKRTHGSSPMHCYPSEPGEVRAKLGPLPGPEKSQGSSGEVRPWIDQQGRPRVRPENSGLQSRPETGLSAVAVKLGPRFYVAFICSSLRRFSGYFELETVRRSSLRRLKRRCRRCVCRAWKRPRMSGTSWKFCSKS